MLNQFEVVVTDINDNVNVVTHPTSEMVYTDVELTLYNLEESFNLTISMTEAKGREIVKKLTEQLDKVDEITKSRKASNKRMLDQMQQLQDG